MVGRVVPTGTPQQKYPNQVGGRIYKELPGPNRVGGARTRTRCALRTAWGLGRGQATRLHPPLDKLRPHSVRPGHWPGLGVCPGTPGRIGIYKRSSMHSHLWQGTVAGRQVVTSGTRFCTTVSPLSCRSCNWLSPLCYRLDPLKGLQGLVSV